MFTKKGIYMLDKLKTLQVNFSLIAFIAFNIKMLITQPTFADSIIVLVLAGSLGYSQFIKRFQPYKLDEAVQKDLLEVKSALSKMNMIRATDTKEKRYF